jgi:hypothetical protein
VLYMLPIINSSYFWLSLYLVFFHHGIIGNRQQ